MANSSPAPLPGGYVDLPGRGPTWVWDTGPAAQPTVVLLHGWTSTAALTWCRCFGPLRSEYRVVAMDLRGHGRGIRSRRPFRLEQCADDLAALLEHLQVGPVITVGYSMGGAIAPLLWRRHPDKVAGLVLCATSASFPKSAVPGIAVAAMGLGLSVALTAVPPILRHEGFRRLVRARRHDSTLAPWAIEESQSGDPLAFVQAGIALNGYDASAWIGDIDVPTAVIVTLSDATIPPTMQRRLAGAIPGSTVLETAGTHRACVDTAGEFVPLLLAACRTVAAPVSERAAT